MQKNQDVLNEVMDYFNKDNIVVPSELYHRVFESVNGPVVNSTTQRANTMKIHVEQPKAEIGMLTQTLKATRKNLDEMFEVMQTAKEKLNNIGFFETNTPLMESMNQFGKKMQELNQEGRTAISNEVESLFQLTNIQRDLLNELLTHLNFLF